MYATENKVYDKKNSVNVNIVYSFSYFKYGIYKLREIKKSDKETSAKQKRKYFFLENKENTSFMSGRNHGISWLCM